MGHFHILLCEEMIFPLLKGKNECLMYEVIIFSHKGWGNAISDGNDEILLCIFLLNPLKNHRIR